MVAVDSIVTLVLVGVAVGVFDEVGTTVAEAVEEAVGGKGTTPSGVAKIEAGVAVSRRFSASSSDSAAMVGSKGANSKL